MSSLDRHPEGVVSSFCASVLLPLYPKIGREGVRSRLRRMIVRAEGGPANSVTIRELLRRHYRVDVGLYTAGPCRVKPQVFHKGTSIGRYSAIADSVRTFTRNHPMNTISTHAVFYNSALGEVRGGEILFNKLEIGNGVWMGHNAIVLPPTAKIGDGAVIAPGAVVCANVPPYALVSGFPARVTGYRFNKETIEKLLASRWWEKSLVELSASSDELRQLLAGDVPQLRNSP